MRSKSAKSGKPAIAAGRRRWLKSMTAVASGAALPLWMPHALAEPASAAATLPRSALIIGNSGYRTSALHTPANDAPLMAAALRKLGFDIDLKLDASDGELAAATRAFSQRLAQHKGIGFFYFAGHGIQSAARNYLAGVDADIDNPANAAVHATGMHELVQQLAAAGNALNVVVLDAGHELRSRERTTAPPQGLAAYDAPSNMLIAYATRPGTTAAGSNRTFGVYARNLAQEIGAAGTTIENAFKRAGLAVRAQSNSQQIPWESSALAGDISLVPQTASWLQETHADDMLRWRGACAGIVRYEDYLQHYPDGNYCELAQFRLDRLATGAATGAVIASIASGPFSKGSFLPDTRFARGDSYSYRITDLFAPAPNGRLTETVTAVSATQVVFDGGERILDTLGNEVKSRHWYAGVTTQVHPAEYAIGRTWSTRLGGNTLAAGLSPALVELDFTVSSKESVTVPAGTFDAFKVEGHGTGTRGEQLTYRYWMAPEVSRRPLAIEFIVKDGSRYMAADRHELTAFVQRVAPSFDARRSGPQMDAHLELCRRSTAASCGVAA